MKGAVRIGLRGAMMHGGDGKPTPERVPYTGRSGVNARTDPLLPREVQQLMEGLLAGDDVAVRTLYARFGRPVYSLGLRLLGTRESAEELTQDVFLTAWRKLSKILLGFARWKATDARSVRPSSR